MRLMSVTRDTSHSAIGPFGPSKQSPFGNFLRQISTALLSCPLAYGENAGDEPHSSRDKFETWGHLERACSSASVKICIEWGRVDWMRAWDFAFVHAPLQEVGDILITIITNNIQKYEDKWICACWWIALLFFCVSLSECVSVSLYESLCVIVWVYNLILHGVLVSGYIRVSVWVCECNTVCMWGYMRIWV